MLVPERDRLCRIKSRAWHLHNDCEELMGAKFKPKKVYFHAHALRDGTIVLALPTKKPRKTRYETPSIDEDGIWRWYVDEGDTGSYNDLRKTIWFCSVANCLNTRRIVRQQVEDKLAKVLDRLEAMQVQLDRIEKRLDAASAGEAATPG